MDEITETKVSDLCNPILQENISSLKVSMQDSMRKRDTQPIDDLLKVLHGLFLRESPFELNLVGKVALVTELRDDVNMRGGLADVVSLHDVLMLELL